MKALTRLPILAAALALSVLPPAARAAEVGKPAPAFTAVDANGKEHNLIDYKGKYVVLEWLNHGCPYVEKHYKTGNMQRLQKKYGGMEEVVWLSVISSAPGKQGYGTPEETLKQAAEKNTAAEAILLDPGGKIGKAYGAKTTPHMYVINPEGTLIYMGAIDDKPTTRHASVEGATNYVANALDEALAGKEVSTASTKAYGCSVKYAD